MNYTLIYGDIQATISSIGAELISLRKANREYIWTGDPAYWNGHNPTLFPIIGFLKDNKTMFDGIEYQIPKHGYARKCEFALVAVNEHSITLKMTDTEETRMGFPFAFSLQITHTLTEYGYKTCFTVTNRNDRPMPFMLGVHTGFCLPLNERFSFEDYTLLFEHTEDNVIRYIAEGGQIITDPHGVSNYLDGADRLALSYSLFDEDALMLTGLHSRKVALLDPNGLGVGMTFDGFDVLGIWTPPGKQAPFLCLEPWNGINAFTNEQAEFSRKPYIRITSPGESYSVAYQVEIIDS